MILPTSRFLAPNARLGTWWTPDTTDTDEEGVLSSLPQRRVPGVLTFQENGQWCLFLSRALPSLEDSGVEIWATDLLRRDRIFGSAAGRGYTLFGGIRTSWNTDVQTYLDEIWNGSWCLESPRLWASETDRVEKLYISFDAAATWSERPYGHGTYLNLQDYWDQENNSFSVPPWIAYEAAIGTASVQLRRGCSWTLAADSVNVLLTTQFEIEDDVELGSVRERWIRPLYDLLSFFWLQDPGVRKIQAKLKQHDPMLDLHFTQPLCTEPGGDDTETESEAPFATLEGIIAKGYSFHDVCSGFWECRARGIDRAIEFLNESQDSLLDHSIDAKLLNASKSLEAYVNATRPSHKRVNMSKAIRKLLEDADDVGDEIREIWRLRGRRYFENSIPEIRKAYAAHGQSDDSQRMRTKDELVDQHWHVVALQWLLRRQYLKEMGFDSKTSTELIRESRGYRKVCEAMRGHYQDSDRRVHDQVD